MKLNFSSLAQTVTSHGVSIKQLEAQIGKILANLNPKQKSRISSDMLLNPKNILLHVLKLPLGVVRKLENDNSNERIEPSNKAKSI